jgi:hypothetical protein
LDERINYQVVRVDLTPTAAEGYAVGCQLEAVLGRSFRLEDAAAMLGQSPGSLLAEAEEALAARIVVAAPDGIAFRHDPVWQVVSDSRGWTARSDCAGALPQRSRGTRSRVELARVALQRSADSGHGGTDTD